MDTSTLLAIAGAIGYFIIIINDIFQVRNMRREVAHLHSRIELRESHYSVILNNNLIDIYRRALVNEDYEMCEKVKKLLDVLSTDGIKNIQISIKD